MSCWWAMEQRPCHVCTPAHTRTLMYMCTRAHTGQLSTGKGGPVQGAQRTGLAKSSLGLPESRMTGVSVDRTKKGRQIEDAGCYSVIPGGLLTTT